MEDKMELNADFVTRWNDFLEKEGIDNVILHNWDNHQMGYMQALEFVSGEEKERILVLVFSGKNEALRPHCKEQETCCDH